MIIPTTPVKKFFSIPSHRVTVAFVIILILSLRYCAKNFYRDPGSFFYKPDLAFERRYSGWRHGESVRWLDQNAHYNFAFVHAAPKPSVCAALVTVKRSGEQYVDATIGSLTVDLLPVERKDLYLSLLVANTDPKVHPTWHRGWLHMLVDEAWGWKKEDAQWEVVERMEREERFLEKSLLDYVKALQRCYDHGAPYVVTIEDDVIAAEGWFAKMINGMRQAEEKARVKGHEIAYMRLFNQERSTGWENQDVGGNHEFWITLAVNLVIVGVALPLRKRSKLARGNLDNWSLVVVCLIAVPSLIILFFQAGKASMLPPSPGVYNENFGCCSQGMVYPRKAIPSLIESLKKSNDGQIDLLINDWARENKLERYSLYPVQMQHIGLTSARGTTGADAQAVWSMAFEGLDAAKLKKEHHALVKSLYGTDGLGEG
jgi:hypothetical protein